MRQFRADLHRFFARRIVRGALILIFGIIVLAVAIPTVSGNEPTAEDYERYRTEVQAIEQQFQDGNPPVVDGGDGEIIYAEYPSEPSDNRIRAADLTDVLEGTGIALLFVMFVLGASFIGADHNVGSLTTQLLYEPRRWRVHAGKSGAALAGCAAVTLLSLGFLVGMVLLGANLNGITEGVDREFLMNRLGQIGRITAACALGGGMAYGVTLVLRRTSAGIVVFFLQYPLMFLVSPESRPLGVFSRILPLRGLVAFVLDPTTITDGSEDIGIRTLAGGVGLTLAWIVVILALSGRLFSRAEIR